MKHGKEVTVSTPVANKYHQDDIIDEIIEYVRYASSDKYAIENAIKILKTYESKSIDWSYEIVFFLGLLLGLLLNIF